MLSDMVKTGFVHPFNGPRCGYFEKSTTTWIAIIRAVVLPFHSPERMLKRGSHILPIPTTVTGPGSKPSGSLNRIDPAHVL
jgi:hypothetical protein